MNKARLINGNKQPYTLYGIKVCINGNINEVALAHIKENTGIDFVKNKSWPQYWATPVSLHAIAKLLLTYNFKTRFINNASWDQTLFLDFNKE